MPGFSQLLKKKGVEEKAPRPEAKPQKAAEEPIDPDELAKRVLLGNEPEEEFVLHNTQLKSDRRGLLFRHYPREDSTKVEDSMVAFGSMVRGVKYGDDWLKVGEYFLPIKINGCNVLYPKRVEEENGWNESADPELTGPEKLPAQPPLQPRTSGPRCVVGTGAFFEVVAPTVSVHSLPSLGAPKRGDEFQGTKLELFRWDPSYKWREVRTTQGQLGWVPLDHPESGPCFRPVGLPFQVKPHEPLCLAVYEKNFEDLKQFLQEGMDVNVLDAGGRTPLMRAVEWGKYDCCMVLIGSRADLGVRAPNGKSVLDLASQSPGGALVRALAGKPFEVEKCQEALEAMQKEHKKEALRIVLECADEHDRIAAERRAQGAEAAGLAAGRGGPPGTGDAAAAARQRVKRNIVAHVGQKYEVQFQSKFTTTALRKEPSICSSIVGKKARGDIVQLLNLDETRQWALVEAPGSVEGTGWLMIRHRDLGDQIAPVGY